MKYLRLGTLELANQNYSLLFDDLTDYDLMKYTYRLRGYHDFQKLRLSSGIAFVKLMASAGQISEVYKDDQMAKTLALFSYQRHSCLTAQLTTNASIHVLQSGYYKLFGNGLVEEFFKHYKTGLKYNE